MVGWLDAAAGTPAMYLKVWKRLLRAIEGEATLWPDGRAVISIALDQPQPDRLPRLTALTDHLARSGHRDALYASLTKVGVGGNDAHA